MLWAVLLTEAAKKQYAKIRPYKDRQTKIVVVDRNKILFYERCFRIALRIGRLLERTGAGAGAAPSGYQPCQSVAKDNESPFALLFRGSSSRPLFRHGTAY